MNKKEELYDEMCRVLTLYESDEDLSATDCMYILYEMLTKIQNNWDSITNGDKK